MSTHHVNLHTHGEAIQKAYENVLDSNNSTNWALFGYDKASNDLKVLLTGDGGLEELEEEFEGSKIQYAFARVIDPNSKLPKFVFISWCGEGVPVTKKALITSHLPDVQARLKGFHLEITARSEVDVEAATILKKVRDSAGAKYSYQQKDLNLRKDIVDKGPVQPVGTNYQRPEIVRATSLGGPAEPVGTRYERPAVPQTDTKSKAMEAFKSSQNSLASPQSMDSVTRLRQERDAQERQLMQREAAAQRERTADVAPVRPTPPITTTSTAPPPSFTRTTPYSTKPEPPVISSAPMPSAVDPVTRLRMEREARDRELMEREKERHEQNESPALPEPSTPSSAPVVVSAAVGNVRSVWADREKSATSASSFVATPTVNHARSAWADRERSAGSPAVPASRDFAAERRQREEEERRQQQEEARRRQEEEARREEEERRQYEEQARWRDEQKQQESQTRLQEEQRRQEEQRQQEEQARWEEEQRRHEEQARWEEEQRRQEEQAQWQRDQEEERLRQEEEERLAYEAKQREDEEARLLAEEEQRQLEAAQHQQQQIPPSAGGTLTVRALYDYDPQEENELRLAEGDIVVDVVQLDPGWWQGVVKGPDGSILRGGLFPANYVCIFEDAVDAAQPDVMPREPSTVGDVVGGYSVRVIYDYTAGEDNEISLREGEVITGVQAVTEDWWSGVSPSGQAGLFPANYVEMIQ